MRRGSRVASVPALGSCVSQCVSAVGGLEERHGEDWSRAVPVVLAGWRQVAKKTRQAMNREQALMLSARTLVTGSATGNQLALLEIHGTAGGGIVRHMHEHEDEVVYVLEGELTFHIGDTVQRARAGSCLVLPKGIEHSFLVGSGPVRLLVAMTPAGLEGILEDVQREDGVDAEHLITVAARYGITITGPSPEAIASATTG